MYPKERQNIILDIIQKQGYATVQSLVDSLHYSTATVNRDLNILEGRGLIKRSYGGAEPVKRSGVPLPFRYDKMKMAKRHVGFAAAELVQNGDTVFIDASTTSQSMVQYLITRKNLTVITNNLAAATALSEYGIEVICLGGRIVEKPSFTGGDDAVEAAQKYHANKMFFSTVGMTDDGRICGTLYFALHRAMMRNSDKVIFLLDHNKLGVEGRHYLCDLSRVNTVISDTDISHMYKDEYPDVEFISADKFDPKG